MKKLINKHKRFTDAEWALPGELVTRIENVAAKLAPKNPINLYQHLFSNHGFEFYEENDDPIEHLKKLDARRDTAILEIFSQNGLDGVIQFAEKVVSPYEVGLALGAIEDKGIEHTLLPCLLDAADSRLKALINGFIWRRKLVNGWEWCDNIDKSEWAPGQIGCFLACLPFVKAAWERSQQWLKGHEEEYWSRTDVNPYHQTNEELAIVVEKLIEHGRPHAAIKCLYVMTRRKLTINPAQCISALLAGITTKEPIKSIDRHSIVKLIKFLQSEPSVNPQSLCEVEWAYLQLLEYSEIAAPKHLEIKLSNEPDFFCELIQVVFPSTKENQPKVEPTAEIRAIAKNAWNLLEKWSTLPGTQENGLFNAGHFNQWLQQVKTLCSESGHLEITLNYIGKVLIYAQEDPDGLWMHRAVAQALNEPDAEKMREGYSTGMYNSRGVHWVDPTGGAEKELAEQFRHKAEAVENAGYHRLAITLRALASGYDREAISTASEYRREEPS